MPDRNPNPIPRPAFAETQRWLFDTPLDGVENMARDEALLMRVGAGVSPPTLRFYRWSPATISLGYFQEIADYEALPAPAGDVAIVRRQTGGGAILHDLELTYSLTLPATHPLLGSNASVLYDHVHAAFSHLLAEIGVPVTRGPDGAPPCSHGGPFFCFERHAAMDLLADGRKIMGSAQRRTADAVLQHGSLILESRFPQQQCASVNEFAKWDDDRLLPRLARAILPELDTTPGDWRPDELALAAEIRSKYASPEWTRRR